MEGGRTSCARAHSSCAMDFCSSFSLGQPPRLMWLGIASSGSGSIVNLTLDTAPASKSARAFGGFPRPSPTNSPMAQIWYSVSPSLPTAEVLRLDSGRNAPGLGLGGFLVMCRLSKIISSGASSVQSHQGRRVAFSIPLRISGGQPSAICSMP